MSYSNVNKNSLEPMGWVKFWGICLVGISGIGLCAAIVIYLSIPNWEERGQFGDMFGVVNTMFSGLAFAGVIYSLHLQSKSLSYQLTELELTRQELSKAAEAQHQTSVLLNKQLEMQLFREEAAFKKDIADARPILVISPHSFDGGKNLQLDLLIENQGPVATDVMLKIDGEHAGVTPSVFEEIPSGRKEGFGISIEKRSGNNLDAKLHYRDIYGNQYTQSLKVNFETQNIWRNGTLEKPDVGVELRKRLEGA